MTSNKTRNAHAEHLREVNKAQDTALAKIDTELHRLKDMPPVWQEATRAEKVSLLVDHRIFMDARRRADDQRKLASDSPTPQNNAPSNG